MGRYEAGDRVRVRPQYRSKFSKGSPAAKGDSLVVSGPNGDAVGLGSGVLDYAYHWELEYAP